MVGCADSRRTPRPRDTPWGSVAVLRPRQRSGRRGRGGRPGFDAICDDLAGRIGAFRPVLEGAGHNPVHGSGDQRPPGLPPGAGRRTPPGEPGRPLCLGSRPLCGIQRSPATRSGRCWACMATILLLISAVLAVTSAVCMVWIRVAAADHRQRWNSPTTAGSSPSAELGDGLGRWTIGASWPSATEGSRRLRRAGGTAAAAVGHGRRPWPLQHR